MNNNDSSGFQPLPVYGHAATVMNIATGSIIKSPKMLVIGGWPWEPSSNVLNSSALFDPLSWKWTKINLPLFAPSVRHYHTMTASISGDFAILFGGYQSLIYLDDVYVLSTTDNSFGWYQINPAGSRPIGRSGHSAVLFEDKPRNQLLIFGGLTGNNQQVLNDLWSLQFTPNGQTSPDQWNFQWILINQSGDIPSARMFHSATIIDRSFYLFGGSADGVNPVPGSKLYVFDIISESWTAKNPYSSQKGILSSGIWGHSAVSVERELILMFGGYHSDFSNQVIEYFVKNDTLAVLDPSTITKSNFLIPKARRSSTAVLFSSNEFISRNFIVQFGGVSDVITDETDILVCGTNDSTSGDLIPEWIISYVSELKVNSTDFQSAVLEITGVGFQAAGAERYDAVTIFPLKDPTDPSSFVDNSATGTDCLLKSADFNRITCVIGRIPKGYFSVIVETIDGKSGESIASAKMTSIITPFAFNQTSISPTSPSSTRPFRSTPLPSVTDSPDPSSSQFNIPVDVIIPSIIGLLIFSFLAGIFVSRLIQKLRNSSASRSGNDKQKTGSEEKYIAMSEETLGNY